MAQQFSGRLQLHLCSHNDHVQYALNKFTLAQMINAGGQTTTKFRIDYGHKKYYDLHPEDVISVQRSSLLPSNLRILAFPMRNEKRIQVDGYLILDEKEGQNGNSGIEIDTLRNTILKWTTTGRPKQPREYLINILNAKFTFQLIAHSLAMKGKFSSYSTRSVESRKRRKCGQEKWSHYGIRLAFKLKW